MKAKILLLSLILIIITSPVVFGAEYWIDPSDQNAIDLPPPIAGTYSRPFKTLTFALNYIQTIQLFEGTSTFYLKPATYSADNETFPWVVWWGNRQIIGSGEVENIIVDGGGLGGVTLPTWEVLPAIEGSRGSILIYVSAISPTSGAAKNITFRGMVSEEGTAWPLNSAILVAVGASREVAVENCVFQGADLAVGGPSGIGIFDASSYMDVKNNVFYDLNIGVIGGRFLGAQSPSQLNVLNNTFHNNQYSAIAYNSGTYLYARNNIVSKPLLYGISDGTFFGILAGLIAGGKAGQMNVSYNNVFSSGSEIARYLGTSPGTGDLNVNPIFENTISKPYDFHLKSRYGKSDQDPHSPCIDAGDPYDDYSGETNTPNGFRINMGAYGGTDQNAQSTTTVHPQASTEVVSTYPQPWQPSSGKPAYFSYYLDSDQDIWVYVYGVSGELAWSARILAGDEGGKEGYNHIVWSDGMTNQGYLIGNGIYIVKIRGKSITKKGYLVVFE